MTNASPPPARPARWRARILPAIVALLLGACASTSPSGRSQVTAPEMVSSLYSAIDLKLTLSAAPAIANACAGIQCEIDKGFERQVVRLGERLAAAAYAADPELDRRVPQFHFIVAEKSSGGSSSDAGGTIVIYRGVRSARMDEVALAYLIAGEMGHVIARHHDEKSAGRIISSLLAQVLLAPVNLAPLVSFLASTTASSLGKDLVATGSVTDKRNEADLIALGLLARLGWSEAEVAESLLDYSYRLDDGPWSLDVRQAAARLVQIAPVDDMAPAHAGRTSAGRSS